MCAVVAHERGIFETTCRKQALRELTGTCLDPSNAVFGQITCRQQAIPEK